LWRSEAGKLAHGKKLATISAGMNAARERRLAGVAEILFVAPIFREIGVGVEPTNWDAGNRREAAAIGLIPIDAGRRADGLFGRFLKRRHQSFFRPLFLRSRGTAPRKDICNRALRGLWLRRGILGHAYPRLMIEGGRTLRKVTISLLFRF